MDNETTTTDAPAPAEGADVEALSQAAAAEPESAPAQEQAVEEDLDLDAEPSEDIYADPAKAKAMVEKLRKEAGKYRTRAKEASEWSKGWTADDAKVLSEVIQLAAADPKVGAEQMRKIADLLDKGDAAGAAEAAAEASPDAKKALEDKPLTAEDVESKVQAALADAEQKRAIETRRDEIISKTKELGYEPGSPDYFTLIHIAQHETGGDIDKAHEKIEARNQAIIDQYVNGVRENALGQPLHNPKPNDSVVEPEPDNKTFDSARSRLEQRLVNLRQG